MANRILQRVVVGVLISIILGFYHQVVKADTYTAPWSYMVFAGEGSTDPQTACSNALPHYPGATQAIITLTNPPYQIGCKILSATNSTLKSNSNMAATQICPGGGTFASGSCTNAPACISPNVRRTSGENIGQCVLPVECSYPLTDNGSGSCTDNQCPSGKVRVPATNTCQTPQTCGSTQLYVIYSNTCELLPLNCPLHQHANTSNDACLWDAPNVCPTGQHDDGSYTCIADEALSCPAGWQYGRINNTPQCIPPTSQAQLQETQRQAAISAANAQHDLQTAQQNYDQAWSEYQNDLTNYTKQQAAEAAATALGQAKTNSNNANSASQQATNDVQNSANTQLNTDLVNSGAETNRQLAEANRHLQTAEDDTKAKNAAEASAISKGIGAFGEIPADEGVHTSVINVPSTLGVSTGGGGGVGACPASPSLSVGGTSITFPMEMICGLVESMRPFVIAMAYISAGFIVMSGTL